MTARKFIVVGAGLGGLATALRLAHRGHQVTVFEKNDFVGGRCHQIQRQGFSFDGGPTLLMMLEPFRKLFADVGENFDEWIDVQLCEPSNRVFFEDGTQIDSSSDLDKMVTQIQSLSGAEDAAAFPKMIKELKGLYDESIPRFVRRNTNSIFDLLSPQSAITALRNGMLGRLDRMMARRFKDQRLRDLFCLQSMYLGLCPWDAPSVYALLTYLEFGEGIWYPKGGLSAIPIAVSELAKSKGVEIQLNAKVASMTGTSVTLATGESFSADAVICNADLPYGERELAKPQKKQGSIKPKNYRYSCSATMMYLGYEGDLPRFAHHNIVLSRNFNQNLREIFVDKTPSGDPSFYVAISSKTEPMMAPPGASNLFVLIPCPHLDFHWSSAATNELESRVLGRLESDFQFDPSKITFKQTRTPGDWQSQFNLDRGAAFGLSHDFFQSVCFRPSNKSRSVPGLYYVGASTTPGNGLPMVLISAELVEKRLEEDGFI